MATTDDLMLDDLRRQAEQMEGRAAPPYRDGEPVFDEPWQGRAMAVAIETVAALGLSWEEFRSRLIAAIDDDPHRSYYDSWLVALDDLVATHDLAAPDAIQAHRMAAAAYRTTEEEIDDLEVFPLAVDEPTLYGLLSTVFEDGWPSIHFGTLIQGAAFEIRAEQRPRLAMLDGYLTIDLGHSHLHLCIGDHRGTAAHPTEPDLARRRRCAHAELQRQWRTGAPRTWMFRMFNGDGDQMLTVLLPNPFLDDDDRLLDEPDWSRLELWDRLRHRYLELPPDPVDRSGDGLAHP
jgi:hypothetical protein